MTAEQPPFELVRAVQRNARLRGNAPAADRPDNPFAPDRLRPAARPWVGPTPKDGGRAPDVPRACLDRALQTPVGLILGPRGSGRSALLRHVMAAAEDRGLSAIFLHAGGSLPTPQDMRRRDLLVTDAAGMVRPLWWARLLARRRRAGTPLLATARRNWIGTVVHRRSVTPAEASAIVRDCLEGSGAAEPPADLVADRLRRSSGSMRAVLESLQRDWDRGAGLAPGWPTGG